MIPSFQHLRDFFHKTESIQEHNLGFQANANHYTLCEWMYNFYAVNHSDFHIISTLKTQIHNTWLEGV